MLRSNLFYATHPFIYLLKKYAHSKHLEVIKNLPEHFITNKVSEDSLINYIASLSSMKNAFLDGNLIFPIPNEVFEGIKKTYNDITQTAQVKRLPYGYNPKGVEDDIIRQISKNIISVPLPNKNNFIKVLFDLMTLLSTKNGVFFGILLESKEKYCTSKFHNLTHPVVLKGLLDDLDLFLENKDKLTLHCYFSEDFFTMKNLEDIQQKMLKNITEYEASYSNILPSQEERETMLKKLVALNYNIHNFKETSHQKAPLDFEYSKKLKEANIYFTDIEDYSSSGYNSPAKFNVTLLRPSNISLPSSNNKKNAYKVRYYLPIDKITNGVCIPYYGGVIITEKISTISNKPVENGFTGENISAFISSNIHTENNRVCTGNLTERNLDTICSINYSNTLSAYTHSTFCLDFLFYIKENINLSISILKEFLENQIRKEV